MHETSPHLTIIAGPNGSGKSTVAPRLMAEFGTWLFLNADVIAKELSPDDPAAAAAAAVKAGRIMHRLLNDAREKRESFALETTLSGMSLRNSIERLQESGYFVRLAFLWVPSRTERAACGHSRAAWGTSSRRRTCGAGSAAPCTTSSASTGASYRCGASMMRAHPQRPVICR